MNTSIFDYHLSDRMVIFTDSIYKDSPYISPSPRDHESIFFVQSGMLLYEKNSVKEIIKEGQIGYIERGSMDKSSAYLCNKVSYIAINFCFDSGSALSTKTLPFQTLCSQGSAYRYEKLFQEALYHYLSKAPGYLTICNGIIMQIIGFLYNEHKIDIAGFQKMQRIEKAIQYLTTHYNQTQLKISDLAAMVNMSEKNFRRIFFDVYQKTPYAFLQEFRLNKAEILLLHTSKTISDISLQCGFSDVYSFSHCFKRHMGISPIQFRAEHA